MSDARHICDHFFTRWESHENALTVSWVGLLRLFNESLQYDTFSERLSIERLTGRPYLYVRPSFMHLIETWHVALGDGGHGCKELREKLHQFGFLESIEIKITVVEVWYTVQSFHMSYNNDRIWHVLCKNPFSPFVLIFIILLWFLSIRNYIFWPLQMWEQISFFLITKGGHDASNSTDVTNCNWFVMGKFMIKKNSYEICNWKTN